MVIELIDNGAGMSKDTIINHFWNLGDSKSRGNQYAIGEKGHGTKIYLRSDKVIVQTNDGIDSYETECEGAFFSLNAGEVHSPKVRKSDRSFSKGTHIRIEGYNNNQRSTLKQDILRDYLYWYTILGTIENQFPNRKLREFKVLLQALDRDVPEQLCSGHPFPKENYNINKLFDTYGEIAADCEFCYVELKYQFGATEFNHSFSNIRYIVCWELSSKVKDGSVLKTSVEDETRILHIIPGTDREIKRCYLDSDNAAIKIKVICLKDYITQKWGITLLDQ